MRKIGTISSVLILTLIFLSSGTIERGLAYSQNIQIEGIQEVEIISTSKQVYRLVPVKKQLKNPFSSSKKTYLFAFSEIPKKVISASFYFKNPLFIRYCNFLI